MPSGARSPTGAGWMCLSCQLDSPRCCSFNPAADNTATQVQKALDALRERGARTHPPMYFDPGMPSVNPPRTTMEQLRLWPLELNGVSNPRTYDYLAQDETIRSEERRVGKECRSRGAPEH